MRKVHFGACGDGSAVWAPDNVPLGSRVWSGLKFFSENKGENGCSASVENLPGMRNAYFKQSKNRGNISKGVSVQAEVPSPPAGTGGLLSTPLHLQHGGLTFSENPIYYGERLPSVLLSVHVSSEGCFHLCRVVRFLHLESYPCFSASCISESTGEAFPWGFCLASSAFLSRAISV